MNTHTEIQELRIWVGKAGKGMGIDLQEEDQISIITEEGCMGEHYQEESDFITAKDLFEIIGSQLPLPVGRGLFGDKQRKS